MFNKIKEYYKQTNKKTLAVYLILRFIVILSLIVEILLGDYNSAFMCGLTLLLFTVPYLVSTRLKITFPTTLEIIILLFIFSAEILGSVQNFYKTFKYFDTILHTINGFLCAAIGFSLIDILNRTSKKIKLSPIFVAIVGFCFSMTIGVLWEFYEFSIDRLFNDDSQRDRIVETFSTRTLNNDNEPILIDNIDKTIIYAKDNDGNPKEYVIENGYLDIGIIDTMKDLIVNFIGAIVFSIFGYLYILNRDKHKFARNFIPTVKND